MSQPNRWKNRKTVAQKMDLHLETFGPQLPEELKETGLNPYQARLSPHRFHILLLDAEIPRGRWVGLKHGSARVYYLPGQEAAAYRKVIARYGAAWGTNRRRKLLRAFGISISPEYASVPVNQHPYKDTLLYGEIMSAVSKRPVHGKGGLKQMLDSKEDAQRHIGGTKVPCRWCGEPFTVPGGLAGHELHCRKNPTRRLTREKPPQVKTPLDQLRERALPSADPAAFNPVRRLVQDFTLHQSSPAFVLDFELHSQDVPAVIEALRAVEILLASLRGLKGA